MDFTPTHRVLAGVILVLVLLSLVPEVQSAGDVYQDGQCDEECQHNEDAHHVVEFEFWRGLLSDGTAGVVGFALGAH